MRRPHRLIPDNTLFLLAEGYAWLPARFRRTDRQVVRTRLLGKPAVALRGPDAVRFFYGEGHVQRRTALPEPVLSTLFGHGSVQTLDGHAHRVRKELFMTLLDDPEGIDGLVAHVRAAWDELVRSWEQSSRVVLFDEASRVLARGVCRWAGLPLNDADADHLARDVTAMVDGFATPGPRHWRARAARRRQEAWVAGLVSEARARSSGQDGGPPARSAVAAVARHRDADGRPLDPRTAAVELLNIVRPTVAIAWFVTFAAHALHRWPEHRERLASGDDAFATAFADEVRRFYPFAPFVGGAAVRSMRWRGERIPGGALVLLDLFGQNHDPGLWDEPYRFDPGRFDPARFAAGGTETAPDVLVPQGGGDPRTGHRCPGERITVEVLKVLAVRLARLRYHVPPQDLDVPLRRVPTRPRSGFVIGGVHAAPAPRGTGAHRAS
ncbi:cytochrome P450 [Actinomadura sp. WMMB 499]|uniref:cytochrome P450 n=1 Tax=Actinomadura sp. WMMB 499 TaxID=1219491 RepID=UPI00124499FC|nr:cytochrome P450 [Actinomadura sp. WMMB 499]QFG23701.1 cytochrome P450 [Actinomadura sp. WMMB 499]